MIKRIISLIIALAMMLTVAGLSVCADSTAINVAYDANTRKVTVSGTFPEVHGNIAVLISKYNEDTLNSYDDLTESNISSNLVHMATWDGADDLVITLPSTVTVGYYVVFCSVMGAAGLSPEVFYITSIDEQNAAISAFKTATAETIATAIQTYAITKPVVKLELDDALYTANTQDAQKIFVNCIADEVAKTQEGTLTLGSIATCFDRALAIVDFNSASDKAATLSNYKTLLELSDTTDSTTYFAAASDLILSQTEAAGGKILSQSALKKAFDKSVAISVINTNTRETARANLKAYEGIIGIDVDAGYNSADETKLNAAMAFGSYTKTEDIKSAFETAVVNNPKQTNQGGGSLGGGGGLGGSGGGGITGGSSNSQTVVAKPPMPTEEDKTPMETEGVFADIGAYTWAKDAISYLNKAGVLQGVGNGNFEPERSIKREEIAKILVEAFDLSDNGQAADFADVSKDAWHYNYVSIAYQHGIVNGVDGESFGTGSFVTREQAVAMVYRYLKSTGYEFKVGGDDFADIDACADYAKEAIKAMKSSGLVNGNGDNTFCPKDSLTRAQAAVMIYNIINEMEAK